MKVSLKPPLERFVANRVKMGQYRSPSDMVNEALEVLKEQEQFTPAHEAFLRREIRRGVAQLDTGKSINFTAKQIIAEERKRSDGNR
ncbi:addiction module antidote protein, CopG/Arc/MetJ family, partial [mine drainage metagenome]